VKRTLSLILTLAALAWPVSQAQAKAISVAPNWSPMVMIGLDVAWTDSNNPAAGGYVTISGRTSSASAPVTPGTTNLKSVGWQLENGSTFQVGDYFTPPLGVLNGASFGRSFGWYSASDLPTGYVWKIVQTSASQGLKVYDPYSSTFGELFTIAAGNAVTYNGNSSNYPNPDLVNGVPEYTDEMFHPVYAVPAQTGSVSATYTVYLATTAGTVVGNVTPGYERFNFNATRNAGTLLTGDATIDGKVDFADYLALEANFGAAGTGAWNTGDFNADRKVDFSDYLILESNFGAASAVPEPTTLTLMALATMLLVKWRTMGTGSDTCGVYTVVNRNTSGY